MSLINDALRKARREAAERDAAERGATYRPPRAHLPDQSRMGLGLVLGLAVGFLGAFAGAYLLLDRPSAPATEQASSTGSSTTETTPEIPSLETASPVAVEAAEPEPEPEPEAEPEPDDSALSGQEAPATEAPDPPVATPPRATVLASEAPASEAPAPAATVPEPSQEETTRPASTPEQSRPAMAAAEDEEKPALIEPPEKVGQVENSNVFVLEADLGDVRLVLDFIVWVPGSPFAQINGQQVEVGQVVEGLLVEKIERDRVTLQGSNGRLVLRVR